MSTEAKDFLRSAKAIGCEAELSGNWVKWTPPLPVEMMMDASRLSDDIWRILEKEEALRVALKET